MEKLTRWLKKYFIPHEHNEFKPHFLRHESMLFVCFLIIVAELAFLAQVFIVFDKTSFLASVLPGVLTTLTNEERAQNNALPLSQNDLLVKAAEMKARDMATRGYFAHTSPDGKTPWYWLDQVGYKYTMAGENLAVNFFESGDVAQAWMNSPTHRANIVKKGYKEIGIGVANGTYEGRNTVFVAQFFGTPFVTPIQTSPTPVTPPKNVVAVKTTPKPPQVAPVAPPSTTTVAVAPVATQVLGEEVNVKQTQTNLLTQFESFVGKVLTSPRQYLTYLYGGIVLLVLLALMLVLFIRSEMKHPAILARGVALMAIIFFLLFVNMKVIHLETKVPTDSLSASVIAY